MDGFQYTNGYLDFFPTAEGYVKVLSSSISSAYKYVFNYVDHLGNIRLSYAQDPRNNNELAILEENHYYPYGLKHNGYNGNHSVIEITTSGVVTLTPVNPFLGDTYKYKFGGKEYDDTFNINTYDFGARNYDPALGRWMNLDPLAESMRRHSPYNYAFDNPNYFIDADGMMGIPIGDPVQLGFLGPFNVKQDTPHGPRFVDMAGNLPGHIIADDASGGGPGDGNVANPNSPIQLDEVNLGTVKSKSKGSGDSSGPDFGQTNNFINITGLGATSLGMTTSLMQEGMLNYRMSLSIENKIGNFSGFRSTYAGLGTASKFLKSGGTAAGIAGFGLDTYNYSTGQISGARYAYHSTSFGLSMGSSLVIGGSVGSGAGLLVGSGFMLGEMTYDSYNDHTVRNNNPNNPHSIGTAIDKANRWNLFSNPRVWIQGLTKGF